MIKAIETRYAGCRFRSRLEARWAVFFDHLNIPWEYEAQGYVVGPYPYGVADGRILTRENSYLPDFFLPQQDIFFEVKGAAPDESYQRMLSTFTGQVGKSLILAVGSIPAADRFVVGDENSAPFWMDLYDGTNVCDGEGSWDNYQAWCVCLTGRHYGVAFMGYGHRIPCPCNAGHFGRYSSESHDSILAAYTAARSARFEHGEQGAPNSPPAPPASRPGAWPVTPRRPGAWPAAAASNRKRGDA